MGFCNPGYALLYNDIRITGDCVDYITTEDECRKAAIANQRNNVDQPLSL